MSKNTEIIGLSDLKPDPQNARKHTPRNIGMVVDALQEVGAARPRSIVIDDKGVILAGNTTINAAGQAGLARVKVVDADGSEIIAVRRTNLTERQKQAWQDVECLYRIRPRLRGEFYPPKGMRKANLINSGSSGSSKLSSFPFAHEFLSAHV